MSAFSQLGKELRTYLSKEQIDQIYQAYLYATKAHGSQSRSSGERYITHPLSVATILAKMQLDPPSIIAAILHDVLEDTPVDKKTLEKQFGAEVTKLVDGVSKLTQIEFESHAEAQAENFRKMMMAMVDDIRVILIKLADRLHNMRTLEHLPREKQKRIAKETLEIYAPIANRLGMHTFRVEFEDLGFSIYYPMRHHVLNEAMKKARGDRKEIVKIIHKSLTAAMKKSDLKNYKLIGREKHLYSIYKKMRNKKLQFSEVMDIYAFRIVVNDRNDCYRVLGIVHNLYKPIPRRFKDYIAIPKANGYQSLHTILFGPYGVPVEIQIRTDDMNKMAENGIAAHWLYKTDEHIVNQTQLRAKEWMNGLMEIQQSASDSLEFVENVKIDLFPDEVYVFTPQGEILELPNGATPIDFAYKVHSDVGNSCVAAKIDRRLAPLSARLRNGQTVEIITSPTARPNPAWLNFVVTGKARSRIRHFLKYQLRSESITLGKRLLENALTIYQTSLKKISKKDIQKLLQQTYFETLDDLYEDIGLGNQVPQILARRLMHKDDFELAPEKNSHNKEPLSIKGSEGVVVHFANCCRPVPGDPIEGVLTAGHGIVVHHERCKNLMEFRKHANKCIALCWAENVQGDFEVELHVEIVNERGMLAKIALTVADEEASIENVNIEDKDERYSIVILLLKVRHLEHLSKIVQRLRKLQNVTKVSRHQSF